MEWEILYRCLTGWQIQISKWNILLYLCYAIWNYSQLKSVQKTKQNPRSVCQSENAHFAAPPPPSFLPMQFIINICCVFFSSATDHRCWPGGLHPSLPRARGNRAQDTPKTSQFLLICLLKLKIYCLCIHFLYLQVLSPTCKTSWGSWKEIAGATKPRISKLLNVQESQKTWRL